MRTKLLVPMQNKVAAEYCVRKYKPGVPTSVAPPADTKTGLDKLEVDVKDNMSML